MLHITFLPSDQGDQLLHTSSPHQLQADMRLQFVAQESRRGVLVVFADDDRVDRIPPRRLDDPRMQGEADDAEGVDHLVGYLTSLCKWKKYSGRDGRACVLTLQCRSRCDVGLPPKEYLKTIVQDRDSPPSKQRSIAEARCWDWRERQHEVAGCQERTAAES